MESNLKNINQSNFIKQKIQTAPWEFSFHQMLHLLELFSPDKSSFGDGLSPQKEPARLHAYSNLSVPHSDCIGYKEEGNKGHLLINQSGLMGLNGAMPMPYTELILQRSRHKDNAISDFLDIFNQRLFGLKYKVEKTSNASSNISKKRSNALKSVDSIAGISFQKNLKWKIIFSPFSAFLWKRPRTPAGLICILEALFGFEIYINQFIGSWIKIDDENLAKLGKGQKLKNKMLGKKAFCLQKGIKLIFAIEDFSTYRSMLPNSPNFNIAAQIAKYYSGSSFDIKLELKLNSKAKPHCILGSDGLLGRSLWLGRKHNDFGCILKF